MHLHVRKGMRCLRALILWQARDDMSLSDSSGNTVEQGIEGDRVVAGQGLKKTQGGCDPECQTSTETFAASQGQHKLIDLPLELLQEILSHLPEADYLTMKFVCKLSYFATKTSVGLDIRGKPGDGKIYMTEYAPDMARIESTLAIGPSLTTLTCSWCGFRAANTLNGFDDLQFRYGKTDRLCMRCAAVHLERGYGGDPFPIHGVYHFMCNSCKLFVPVSSKVSADDLDVLFGGILNHQLKSLFCGDPRMKACINCVRRNALWKFNQLTRQYIVTRQFEWRTGYSSQKEYHYPFRHDLTHKNIQEIFGAKMVMNDLERMRYFETCKSFDYDYLAGLVEIAIDSIFFSLQQTRLAPMNRR